MKATLTAGIALALLTGAALAQAAGPNPAPAGAMPPLAPMAAPADAPPPGGPGTRPALPGGPGGMADHGPGGRAGMADRGPDGPDGHRPPPPPRGAHIHLQRGDLVLDVKCPDDEAMASCSDAALRLLDRMEAGPAAK